MAKNKKPTEKEIEAEIAKLREMEPHILPRTIFGDSNRDAIAAAINVLERRWTEHDIYDEYPYATGEEDVDEVRENVHSAALEAAEWLAGENETQAPSVDWESLDERKRKKEVKDESAKETRVRPVSKRSTVRRRSSAGSKRKRR